METSDARKRREERNAATARNYVELELRANRLGTTIEQLVIELEARELAE